ncbi:MAG TPA: hypothetical protein VGE74_08955 [Gemmata sp.]
MLGLWRRTASRLWHFIPGSWAVPWIYRNRCAGHVPGEVRPHFSEKALADLICAVVITDGRNRLAVSFRPPPGAYKPHLRAPMVARVTGPAVAN